MPTGLFVVGSRGQPAGGAGAGGGAPAPVRHNLMTANWCQQVATEPKLVATAVEASVVTAALIRDGGVFAVSILRRQDRALVRRFVKPVTDVTFDAQGRPVTMAGHDVVVATTGAPVLAVALAWLDCEIRHELVLGSHVLFVGEVVDAGGAGAAEGDDSQEGGAEVLRMEDTRMNYGG